MPDSTITRFIAVGVPGGGFGHVRHVIHQVTMQWAMLPDGTARFLGNLALRRIWRRHFVFVTDPASFECMPGANDAVIIQPPVDSVKLPAAVLHTLEQFVEVFGGLNVVFNASAMKDVFHLVAETPPEWSLDALNALGGNFLDRFPIAPFEQPAHHHQFPEEWDLLKQSPWAEPKLRSLGDLSGGYAMTVP
jgi:hypothetical protein